MIWNVNFRAWDLKCGTVSVTIISMKIFLTWINRWTEFIEMRRQSQIRSLAQILFVQRWGQKYRKAKYRELDVYNKLQEDTERMTNTIGKEKGVSWRS